MPDTLAQRNAALDALVTATKKWGQTEVDNLTANVNFLKKMLTARGQGSLLDGNQAASEDLVVTEINNFLAG